MCHFTWRSKYVHIVDSSMKCFVAWQQWWGNLVAFSWQHCTVLCCCRLHVSQQQCEGNAFLRFRVSSGYANAQQDCVVCTYIANPVKM